MKIYKDKDLICDVPDNLLINDTIINKNKIYVIISKTWDNDNKELYCKIEELKEEISSINDILKTIYQSDYFETSGNNTNNIQDNPKTIILLTIAGLIIEPGYFNNNHKRYKNNIMVHWNNKKILWNEIFNDNPPIHINDLKAIKLMTIKLLTELKINKNLWPKLD
jgi:hypothetical protein